MEITKLIIEILALVFGVIGGCWTVFQMIKRDMEKMETSFQEGFKTIFTRMDKKQEAMIELLEKQRKDYYIEFVKKEIYELEIKHQEQRTLDKFLSVQKIFETMFNNLEEKIDSFCDQIKENHDGNGKKG